VVDVVAELLLVVPLLLLLPRRLPPRPLPRPPFAILNVADTMKIGAPLLVLTDYLAQVKTVLATDAREKYERMTDALYQM
jgi:hypothetical protein